MSLQERILDELKGGDRTLAELRDATGTNYAALNRAIKHLLNEGAIAYRFAPHQVFFIPELRPPRPVDSTPPPLAGWLNQFAH